MKINTLDLRERQSLYTNNNNGEQTLEFDKAVEWFKAGNEVDISRKEIISDNIYIMCHKSTLTKKTHAHLLV